MPNSYFSILSFFISSSNCSYFFCRTLKSFSIYCIFIFLLCASVWNYETLLFYFYTSYSRVRILDSCFARTILFYLYDIWELLIEFVSSSCFNARISFIAFVFYFSSSCIFCLWLVTSFSCYFIIIREILDWECDWLPVSDLSLSLRS